MALDKESKDEITKEYQLHKKDTGSADVQIALLTEKIKDLIEHLNQFPDDNGARLALLKQVDGRRRLLKFLNSTDTARYFDLCRRLGLRK